jgi:hypothetical protein
MEDELDRSRIADRGWRKAKEFNACLRAGRNRRLLDHPVEHGSDFLPSFNELPRSKLRGIERPF